MTRARVCAAAALFSLGVLVISSAAFPQTIPINWEGRYLNLKDNLRALAIDPLDPKVVLIGSDLAVIATRDGGENWAVGESFRTSSYSVTGSVSDEVLETLYMFEETEESPAPPPAPEDSGPGTGEAPPVEDIEELESEIRKHDQAAAAAEAGAGSLESELATARETLAAAEQRQAAAEAAAALWEPDPLTEGGVQSSNDENELAEWLEERSLPVPESFSARQNDLITYLSAHADKGSELQGEMTAATAARAEAAGRVADLESQLAAAARTQELAGEEAEEAEESVEMLVDESLDQPEAAEEQSPVEEEEEEVVEIEVTGVNYLAFDPAASEKVYLAAFDGVYRSEDTGSSWKKIYTGPNPPQSAALCLAIDPSNPDAIFAGTFSGLARTLDGGQTWDRPPGRIANMVITRIAVHPFDSRIVLAGTAGYGIFKSTDGGSEWNQVLNRAGAGANRVLSIRFASSQPEVIYAGTASGIYKSLDGGESWDPATGMGLSPTVLVRDLVVSPINPDQAIVAGDQGVFGTVDGGQLWRKIAFGTDFNGSRFLAFDPLDPATVWLLTSSRAFRSAAPDLLDLSDGAEQSLAACGEITLNGEERHRISIEKIDEETGEVTVSIQSEPRILTLKVGETAAVDLTGDGNEDLNLTLESLEGGVPRFRLCRIAPELSGEEAETAELIPPDQVTCLEDLEPYFRMEPTWVEVQQAAARWAEVHPEKIAAWRAGASWRALFPEVQLDYDNRDRRREDYEQEEEYSYSRDIEESWEEAESFSYEERIQYQTAYTAGTYEIFRRDNEINDHQQSWEESYSTGYGEGEEYQDTVTIRDNDEKSWGIQLEWELGDFLFNIDQVRISSEVRRLVELRQDVVEQVSLYYFDRRTARIDMILNPPADPFSRVEMLLRIQQLDASLDAMTGGYFSQTIKEREQNCRR